MLKWGWSMCEFWSHLWLDFVCFLCLRCIGWLCRYHSVEKQKEMRAKKKLSGFYLFIWETQNIISCVWLVFGLSCNLCPSILSQEIPLSEILQVEQSRDYSNLAQGSNPHCFEIITATMVYYVGENNCSHYHSPALAASGVGMEVAQGWEKAIRQALMPVTPQPSVASAVGQGKDHSK